MKHNITEIHPIEALDSIKKGALLLDVREWEEIEMLSFDLDDQLMIPLSEIAFRFREIPLNREVIIACHSGNRSMQAAAFLKSQLYETVSNLQGGISNWVEHGLPVQWENFKTKTV